MRVEPDLDLVANGAPATTPALDAMWAAWGRVVDLADPFMDALTTEDLERPAAIRWADECPGRRHRRSSGSRTTTGRTSARRRRCGRLLGHTRLAQFVGDIESQAPYRRED